MFPPVPEPRSHTSPFNYIALPALLKPFGKIGHARLEKSRARSGPKEFGNSAVESLDTLVFLKIVNLETTKLQNNPACKE